MPDKTEDLVKKLITEALESQDEKIKLLEDNVNLLNASVTAKEGKIRDLQKNVDWLSSAKLVSDSLHVLMLRKIDQNEQYSRKQNLIVDGMRITKYDSDDNIRNMLLDEIKRLNIDLQDFEVVRAHRTGRSYTDRGGKKHTPIIVRFSTWRARDLVWQMRKKSNFFYTADLTDDRAHILKVVQGKINDPGSIANNLVNFVCADRNCNLTLASKDRRYKFFNSVEEFDRLLDFLDNTQPPYAAINKLIENDKKQQYTGTKIVNLTGMDIDEWVKDPNNKYIGRAHGNIEESLWANPYTVQEHGRDKAIEMYKERLLNTPSLITNIDDLHGFQIGCGCSDDCFGQILVDLIYAKHCV